MGDDAPLIRLQAQCVQVERLMAAGKPAQPPAAELLGRAKARVLVRLATRTAMKLLPDTSHHLRCVHRISYDTCGDTAQAVDAASATISTLENDGKKCNRQSI